MNKKDIAAFKRQLKEDGKVEIKHLARVFAMGESREIIYHESGSFAACDESEQALYFSNFKKLLTGAMDSKIFELPFNTIPVAETLGQSFLYEMLQDDTLAGFEGKAVQIMEKIIASSPYEGDLVANFIKAEYLKPQRRDAPYGEEDYSGADETSFKMKFILCSVNKIESSEKSVRFDYRDRRFMVNHDLNAVLNLNAPLEGFMFPSIVDDAVDVNKVIYSTAKAEQLNVGLIDGVLNAGYTRTAKEEKEQFDTLIKVMVGDRARPEVVKNIYESVDMALLEQAEEEVPVVELEALERVLKVNGVDTSRFAEVAEEIAGEDKHFKPGNVVPGFRKKSIKISTAAADIAISPEYLDVLRQVVDRQGRKCLLIQVDEDIEINGIKLEVEVL